MNNINWKEGLQEQRKLNTYCLQEIPTGRKQIYALEPWRRQKLVIVDTTEAGHEIRDKNRGVY